jgi:transposase
MHSCPGAYFCGAARRTGRHAQPVHFVHSAARAKVAVETIKAHKTTAQIAQMFGVHPTQVGAWKKQALAGRPEVFSNGHEHLRQQADDEKDELYKQIGQLKVELDSLKRRAGLIT